MEALEKIENYLQNILNEKERIEFERELSENPELQTLQEKYVLAKDAIISSNIRNEVRKVHQNFMANRADNQAITSKSKPMGKQISLNSSWMRMAASVLVFLSFFAIYQYTSLDKEGFLADATIEYNSSTLRGKSDDLQQIRNLYKSGDFEQTLSEIKKITTFDSEILFLKAMANFKLKNYETAINDFETLKKQNLTSLKPSYIYEIEYYGTMALVGTEKYELAIEKLENIKQNTQNTYSSSISSWDIFKLKILNSK